MNNFPARKNLKEEMAYVLSLSGQEKMQDYEEALKTFVLCHKDSIPNDKKVLLRIAGLLPDFFAKWKQAASAETLYHLFFEDWEKQGNKEDIENLIRKAEITHQQYVLVWIANETYEPEEFTRILKMLIARGFAAPSLLAKRFKLTEELSQAYQAMLELCLSPKNYASIPKGVVASLSGKELDSYYTLKAIDGKVTLSEVKNLPENLQKKILEIQNENAQIAYYVGGSVSQKGAEKTIYPRVQVMLAKEERWAILYWNSAKHQLADETLEEILSKTTDRGRREKFIFDYFGKYPISDKMYNYLVFSPNKHLARLLR